MKNNSKVILSICNKTSGCYCVSKLENGLTILLLHCFVFATFVTKMPRNSLGPTIGRYMPFFVGQNVDPI